MKLIDDWHFVLKKAWSVRLIVLSAIMSVLETVTQLADTSDPAVVVEPITGMHITRGTFAILSAVIAVAALVVRFIAQKDLTDGAA